MPGKESGKLSEAENPCYPSCESMCVRQALRNLPGMEGDEGSEKQLPSESPFLLTKPVRVEAPGPLGEAAKGGLERRNFPGH